MPNGNEFDNAPLISAQNDRETQNFVNNIGGINSKELDENIDFVSRLVRNNVEADIKVENALPHGFMSFYDIHESAKNVLDSVVSFVHEKLVNI